MAEQVVDFCCGAGGFSHGFAQAGFSIAHGVDNHQPALDSFSENLAGEVWCHDVTDGVPGGISPNECDVLIGSPPGDGVSDARGERDISDDSTVFAFCDWLQTLQPKVAVMESVTGLGTIDDSLFKRLLDGFEDAGYTVEYETLNAADYGVPQTRERIVFIAVSDTLDTSPSFPEAEFYDVGGGQRTLFGGSQRQWRTVHEAIADLGFPVDINDDYNGTQELKDPQLVDWRGRTDEYAIEMRCGLDEVTWHVARGVVSPDKATILSALDPGQMFRSNRSGDRCVPVWEIFDEKFDGVEKAVLKYLSQNRHKKGFSSSDSGRAVPVSYVVDNVGWDADVVEAALVLLKEGGWVREKPHTATGKAYDITTQAGLRPKYIRLPLDEPSDTLLTTDFTPRDRAHPRAIRGISIREAARLQSIPDTFDFVGSFTEVANQVGRAFPPLFAKAIANHISTTHIQQGDDVAATSPRPSFFE